MSTREETAKRFFSHQDAVAHYRIRVVPDFDYSLSDWLDEEDNKEQWEFLSKLLEDNGAWGFIVERTAHGHWEHVDSCWCFIGDYAFKDTLAAMAEHISADILGKALWCDEQGKEI